MFFSTIYKHISSQWHNCSISSARQLQGESSDVPNPSQEGHCHHHHRRHIPLFRNSRKNSTKKFKNKKNDLNKKIIQTKKFQKLFFSKKNHKKIVNKIFTKKIHTIILGSSQDDLLTFSSQTHIDIITLTIFNILQKLNHCGHHGWFWYHYHQNSSSHKVGCFVSPFDVD